MKWISNSSVQALWELSLPSILHWILLHLNLLTDLLLKQKTQSYLCSLSVFGAPLVPLMPRWVNSVLVIKALLIALAPVNFATFPVYDNKQQKSMLIQCIHDWIALSYHPVSVLQVFHLTWVLHLIQPLPCIEFRFLCIWSKLLCLYEGKIVYKTHEIELLECCVFLECLTKWFCTIVFNGVVCLRMNNSQ